MESTTRPSLKTDALHLFALWSFAVAQPLYDVLGRNPVFFVAHGAGPSTIFTFVLLVSFAAPLTLVGIEAVAGRISSVLRHHLHTLVFATLAALTAAGALTRAFPHRVGRVLVAAVLIAIATTAMYRLLAIARRFVTVLSPAALVFPAVFLLATPVSRLAFPATVSAPAPVSASSTSRTVSPAPSSTASATPVILVVFDELTTFALLDGNGDIDGRRYPHFAGLARESYWFPNAKAVFAHTERALPALLTGISYPYSAELMPVAADHPKNLITWLAGTHRLNVSEAMTAMCPQELCPPEPDMVRTGARLQPLIRDAGIVYLHTVTPKALAMRMLPSISSGWTDFGQADPTSAAQSVEELIRHREGMKLFDAAVRVDRVETFRRFAGKIRRERRPSFSFIHTLMSHHPYQYLPSGRLYSGTLNAQGLGADGVWTRDRSLALTGYRQYLAQLQFADKLLGELIERLRAEKLYDDALLIVTADHGAAVRPGESHRNLTRLNHRELLAIPLLVKLPGQQRGTVDEKQVSASDVVPTIADVLGESMPWRTDGFSMLADILPDRSQLSFDFESLTVPNFDVRQEARTPERRQWLAEALANEPFPALVGKRVADLAVGSPHSGMTVFSDAFRALRTFSRHSEVVPALIQGWVERDDGGTAPMELAIAVNGVVQAVTQTAAWNSSPLYFAALLPESVIQTGANRLDVLRVDRGPSGIGLARIPSAVAEGLEIRKDAGVERLVASDGTRLDFNPYIVGSVDRVESHQEGIRFVGWAADAGGTERLRSVAVLIDGRAVAFAVLDGERPDVAKALDLKPARDVSYVVDVPHALMGSGAVRLFGLSVDGHAGELQLSPPAAQGLPRWR